MESMVNIYVRNGEGDDDEHDDIWDDELLIKAYSKSVDGIKEEIAKRIGRPILNGVSGVCKQKDKPKRDSTVKVEMPRKGQNKTKWKVGDFCRAIYSDDGLEYEAQIINISDGQSVVKFLGYNNEEIVSLKHLKKSLGESRRSAQKLVASESFTATIPNGDGVFSLPSVPGIPAIPPPPAFTLTSQFKQETESDALSAMLMSWYMSGYHTGYYQGLMQAKKQMENMAHFTDE